MEKTIAQVSEETGITQSALQKALKAGRLPGRKISPILWLIDVDNPQFEEFLQENQKWHKVRGKEIKNTEE